MFRRSSRRPTGIQLDEVHGVRTHAQRSAARLDRARTQAISYGVQPR